MPPAIANPRADDDDDAISYGNGNAECDDDMTKMTLRKMVMMMMTKKTTIVMIGTYDEGDCLLSKSYTHSPNGEI